MYADGGAGKLKGRVKIGGGLQMYKTLSDK